MTTTMDTILDGLDTLPASFDFGEVKLSEMVIWGAMQWCRRVSAFFGTGLIRRRWRFNILVGPAIVD